MLAVKTRIVIISSIERIVDDLLDIWLAYGLKTVHYIAVERELKV